MKIKKRLKFLRDTKVVEGSRVYFIILVISYKLVNNSKLISRKLQRNLKSLFPKVFKRKLVIENSLGKFLVGADDSLYKSSPSFEGYLHEWVKRDKRKETFVDVGANVGFYTFLALNKLGYQRAYSFEANPDTCKVLEKNVDLNRLQEKATAVCMGLSDKRETLKFEKRKCHTGGSRFVSEEKGEPLEKGDHQYVEISTETFDDYAEKIGMDTGRISFIKIDVEGFELEVLKGMSKTLRELKKDTYLFVEIWKSNLKGKKTLDLLEKSGFREIDSRECNILFLKNRGEI